MKVYVFSDGKRHGCYVYREEIPLEALERRGHQVLGGLMRPDCDPNLADVDIFIMPRLLAADYPLVVDEIKRAGKLLVYDMDDAADLFERFHTSYFQVRNLLPSYYFLLKEADLVTTTTPRLAAHFSALGAKRVEVLPNTPPPHAMWLDPPQKNRPVRIGYTGWTAHMLDAAYWLEIIAALRQLRKDFTPVLFGIAAKGDAGPEWMDKARDAVKANPVPNHEFGEALIEFHRAWAAAKDGLEWHSMCDIDDYAVTLGSLKLDIGCAVLLDSPFNRCKSCIKMYDYAQAGAVCLASEVPPYIDEPAVRVPNRLDSWVRLLSLYIDSAQYRHSRLQEQREWIQRHRDPDKWAERRERLYSAMLKERAPVA